MFFVVLDEVCNSILHTEKPCETSIDILGILYHNDDLVCFTTQREKTRSAHFRPVGSASQQSPGFDGM